MHQEKQITVLGNSQKNERLHTVPLGTSFTEYFGKIYRRYRFQCQDE